MQKEKLQVIITKGLPASGKTTYALNWVMTDEARRVRIEKDTIRKDTSLFRDGVYNHARGDESIVIKTRDEKIHQALTNGKSVICSDTNLVQKHIVRISNIAKKYDAEVIIKEFLDVPLKELIERDAKRSDSVGEQVIRQMFHHHVKTMPTFLKNKPNLEPVVVCDLDGTLTLGPKNRSPYDWAKVGQDDINLGVAHLLDGVRVINYAKVFIFSGRDGICRPETEEWLERHNIEYDLLEMRPAGDSRSDEIIKSEMIEKHIKDKYNVVVWFDDRVRIATMLRDVYGINVAQIGDTRCEF